ncbi:RNA polymerase sigma-70 factor [Sphingobacterium corticibacterium]|uniref:RNA polymerase sigma-70 factor n=1 Tax=Sphingobacterium corticibacterium TaxID=2484746 RepID=A0A4Q6XH45_9SPHI|nr:RNA polymerase sigma-70 factor [Sphingobacterium corticibacterium]RZF58853.1 RNA polymerase sigma-70 factor [Sphingobacterium corticibacterium]
MESVNDSGYVIDEKTFNVLYDAHWRDLLRYAYHFCGDLTIAEELVQDVFLSVWQRRKTIGRVDNQFDRYLRQAIRYKIIDTQRTKANEKKYECEQYVNPATTISNQTEETILFDDLNEQIDRLLDQLPAKCHEVYKLNRKHGMDKKEIADALSLSEKTVDHYLYNALMYLRLHLSK